MKKKILSMLLVMTILLTNFLNVEAKAANNIQIDRVAGGNRFDTSTQISGRYYSGAKYLVIASGENYPDALVGGTLSTQINAPMLLTSKASLDGGVKGQIMKFKNKGTLEEVFLLGGTGSISKKVEYDILALGVKVTRLAGGDRKGTAIEIGKKRAEIKGIDFNKALYAGIDGNNFADALGAGPFIGKLEDEFYALIPNMNKGSQDLSYNIVFGGVNSIPKAKETSRYAGNNRYTTAIKIAQGYKSKPNTVVLVNGDNYPDALAASSVSGSLNAPIMLTNSKSISEEVLEYILSNDIQKVIIVGGENSISGQIVKQIKQENTGTQTPVTSLYKGYRYNKVFHKDSCSVVAYDKNSPNLVTYANREEAIGEGKIPCKQCNP